jgi:hypothetical protein
MQPVFDLKRIDPSMKASTKPEFNVPTHTLLVGMLALILVLNFAFVSVSAMNEWLDTDPVERTSTVDKPVDPVFMNTGNDSIVIPVGESWDFIYNLKSGHRYHIFLVGDWIHNASSPMTDYDIYTYKPSGAPFSSHTESAGLPEQVSTDENHHYFVPEQTGEYTLRIVNDERDSENAETAILMVLEHIDVNTEYSQFLEGRDSNDNEVLYTGWAFEFNTSAPEIRIFVDVPSLLDMYEARLFAMAKPESDIGYSLYGIGAPLGDFFNEFSGEYDGYGGFNTYSQGDRNIEAMDSGEYSGQDLEFMYDSPNSYENQSDIFYYLVLIAEHGQGTVDFFVQTDFEPPVISLDPPEVGVEGEDTEITVTIEDDTEIEEIWIEYSTDDGETWRTKDLSEKGDGYSCELGSLFAGEYVDFTIYAEDAFGNIGSIESGFQVKRKSSLECFVANKNLYGGESAMVTGSSNLDAAPVELEFTSGEIVKNYQIRTDENGAFGFSFAPPLLGEWSFQAQFEGSETEFPASSKLINFTVANRETHVSGFLSETQVKKNEPITVAGSVMPKLPNLAVEILFVSSTDNHMEEVSTSADGSFSFAYEPAEEGVWNVVAKVGDGFIYAVSSSDIMEFEVLPLTIIDKVYVMAQKMIEPPYLYGTLGFIGVGLSSVIYVKRDSVISALPSGLAKRLNNDNKKSKRKNGKNGKRYRRKKK